MRFSQKWGSGWRLGASRLIPPLPPFQYGFINTCLQSLVTEKFGEETWEKLK